MNEICIGARRTIVKGENAKLTGMLFAADGSLFDLTGKTLSAAFRNQDGSVLSVPSAAVTVVSPATSGKFQIELTQAQTSGIREGEAEDFDLIIDQGGDRRIVAFRRSLSVVARIA